MDLINYPGSVLSRIKNMAPTLLFAIITALLSHHQLAQGEEIYKWVDEKGNIHFGSRPPGESEYQKVEVQETNSSAPPSEAMSDSTRKIQYRSSGGTTSRSTNRPDYVCTGAKDQVQSIEERWQNTRRNGYTQGEKQSYEQRKQEAERHVANVCR